jgi:hypothetical protein
MPDLSLALALVALGRTMMVAYAALATVLTTACLVLHALTALDRRLRRARRRAARPLFVRLDGLEGGS